MFWLLAGLNADEAASVPSLEFRPGSGQSGKNEGRPRRERGRPFLIDLRVLQACVTLGICSICRRVGQRPRRKFFAGRSSSVSTLTGDRHYAPSSSEAIGQPRTQIDERWRPLKLATQQAQKITDRHGPGYRTSYKALLNRWLLPRRVRGRVQVHRNSLLQALSAFS